MDGSGLRYRDAFINFPPFAQTIYIQEGAEFKIQCAQYTGITLLVINMYSSCFWVTLKASLDNFNNSWIYGRVSSLYLQEGYLKSFQEQLITTKLMV